MEPFPQYYYLMAFNLSIKKVPGELIEKLRSRALRNHRSIQGELLAILEEALSSGKPAKSLDAVLAQLKKSKLKTKSESVSIVRKLRNSR